MSIHSSPFDRVVLANLPTNWVETLEDAAVCGNDRAIVELASQLLSKWILLDIQLTELTDKFQFEQIIQLIHWSTPP
ncbi:MAG TPA: hypothetical protein V6D10_17440 [Trichocoleus sp.]|jgi:hypothetical protein